MRLISYRDPAGSAGVSPSQLTKNEHSRPDACAPSRVHYSIPLLVLCLTFSTSATPISTSAAPSRSAMLARQAVSEDQAEAAAAIEELRWLGPAGLKALFQTHADSIAAMRVGRGSSVSSDADGSWRRLTAALDAVSGQRDSYTSGLYWYTDVEQAKDPARLTRKPILSLRLLGRLDEDLSCANSRFFRITLYANEEVSRLLAEKFVLHWKSERPVPRVTIDFGDGRKLERTLTGNSIHYVLDPEGRVVDALPGLYGPRAFVRTLLRAEQAARISNASPEDVRERYLRNYHTIRIKEIDAEWSADLIALRVGPGATARRVTSSPAPRTGNPPTAERAARVAMTKMVAVERPILRGISFDRKSLEDTTDDQVWARIGLLHAQDAELDASTRVLIKRKALEDDPSLAGRLQNLQRMIAMDSVRNEYTFHRTIYEWLLVNPAIGLESLNERVYSELFLTPSSDPWLGLFPRDSYTGIDREGIRR